MLRLVLILMVGSCINACTYQYAVNTTEETLQHARLKSQYTVKRQSDWIIHSKTVVSLAYPVQTHSTNMPRNLATLYDALGLALKQVFPAYTSAQNTVSLDEAFEFAAQNNSEILFWPSLVLSENRLNTERELREGKTLSDAQSYGPDRAVFQVLIYEVRTRRLIDVGHIKSRGRMFAPNESLPLDLFRDAARSYVLSITGKSVS